MDIITRKIRESIEAKQKLQADETVKAQIMLAADKMVECYRDHGGATYFCGNGGSAADAQHLAAELVSRFYLERQGLASQALTVNTSVLTAVGNDYDYERIFARQVEAFVKPHDVVVGLSTSGNSRNVIAALSKARERGAYTVGFTGATGGKMKDVSDCCVCVPSTDTPRIQECHILLGHILCEIVEARLAGK
jgi:D-sedoheptulose 7-phosphate isomerase